MIVAIQLFFRILSFVVIMDVVLSFLLPPFNPIRNFLDRIVNPMLNPIRKLIPAIGGFDFSPIVLVILIQGVEYLVVRLF